jgi:single-strand DNA-binding protein
MFNLKGEIKAIGDIIQITQTFKKRAFIIKENSSSYAQQISFQLTQERCGLIDAFSLGKEVVVSFNIKGR